MGRNVAIYIRWSTEDQGQGTTLEVQRDGCMHFAQSQGWAVRDDLIFVDEGYSGSNLDRPALTRMRQAVQDGLVDCVVVFKLDRLSRSVLDMVKLVMEEWGGRCAVRSAREPIDTAGHAGKMFFYTLASFAEWERSVIRERTFSGKAKRAESGRNPGFRPPYGYAPGPDHTFVTCEAEAAVVRRLFERYAAGESARALAADLNRTGPPFRGGRPWRQQTVHRILQNPIYAGDLVWGVKRSNPQYRSRPGELRWVRNEQPLVQLPGALPAVVPRELAARVQAERAARPAPHRARSSGRGFTSPYLLTGLLRCGACGAAMVGRTRSGRSGPAYYCCAGRLAGRCRAPYLRAAPVDRLVGERMVARYGGWASPEGQARLMQKEQSRREAELQARLAAVQERQSRLAAQAERLQREYREGEITIAEYRQFLAGLQEDVAANESEAARIRSQAEANNTRDAPLPANPWECLDRQEQRAILRHLLKAIRCTPDGRGSWDCLLTWKAEAPPGGGA